MELLAPIAGFTFNPLLMVAVGMAAGILAGMVGLGGGLILVPFLILYGVAPNVAAATATCYMVSTSLAGLSVYSARGKVDIRAGILLMAGSLFGGTFGVFLVKDLLASGKADYLIRVCFVVITGIIGLSMLWDSLRRGKVSGKKGERETPSSELTSLIVIVCGVAAGLTASILGIAGGVFVVPFLIYFMGFETRTAVGTSLMSILFTASWVSGLHSFQNRNLDMTLAFFLVLGSGGGVWIGSYLSQKADSRVIRLVFSVIALAGSARLWAVGFTGVAIRKAISEGHSWGDGVMPVCMALGVGLLWGAVLRRRP